MVFRGRSPTSTSPHRRQRSSPAHHPSRQRRSGTTPSAASRGRPQVVNSLYLQPTADSGPSGPAIATTQSPRASSYNIPQHPYSNNYCSPYFRHPGFPSLAHVEAMRFPQVIHYPPQGAHPPRTHMRYMPSTSPVGLPILPPLGPPNYHYPPPLVPYNRTQQFPPLSTPGSPFISPQRGPDWTLIASQRPPTRSQRRNSPGSAISSVSPIHTQPSESTESLMVPPAPPPTANVPVVDPQRRLFSSAPAPSREDRSLDSLDIPARPSSAPAVFPATATTPHDARSRPTVPVTQYLGASVLGGQLGQLGPDLPNARTAGRRHKQ